MEKLDTKNALFLDTETTGLDEKAEIVEISIIDEAENIVFSSLVRPKGEIPEQAIAVHGITNEMVQAVPAWEMLHPIVSNMLVGQRVIIYNAGFDVQMLEQTAESYGLQNPEFEPVCAMLWYADFWGEWDDYRGSYSWQSLSNAAAQQGIEFEGAHRAVNDCIATAKLVKTVNNKL